MEKKNNPEDQGQYPGMSRRIFFKTMMGILLAGVWSTPTRFVSAEDEPAEPENLDVPTSWQVGDPNPVEQEVPAEEPEQTSTEAPPSQPMADERPEQPNPDHAWVSGYWWWTNRTYVWVPGYWALPPHARYVYISGYWTHKDRRWVYVRGGWAKPNTTKIVVYPRPRPRLRAFVIAAPRRIVRRHRNWRHRPGRPVHGHVHRPVKKGPNHIPPRKRAR